MMRIFLLAIFFISSGTMSYSQSNLQQFQNQIDEMVQNAIDSSFFPGAQVLIMHKDELLVSRAYGYHTYDKKSLVKNSDLYDLASVTKVMAGGLALMKLNDMGLFDPNEKLGETHPSFNKSNKSDITWREILAHQSGMKPYIVFWQTAKNKKGNYKWRTFSYKENRWNSIAIDKNLFLHRRYPSVMKKLIKESPVNSDKKYLYSGLGFLLIPDLVYSRSGMELNEFLDKEVYSPLSIERLTFRPLDKFNLSEIIPTESDTFFRKKIVHGYVHDENASMLNGVSANAGLFANASSLGKIAKLLLDEDNEVIDSQIIASYTKLAFPEHDNRRGLTFDKPQLDYNPRTSYVAKDASPSSFGHSGFTGTFFWIDPEHELTVILLSNRVYPYRSNRKLYTSNFRPFLHQAAYDYILDRD